MLKFRKEQYKEYQAKTYRLPKELIQKIDELAAENNCSCTSIVIQALEFALNNVESEEQDS